MKNNKPLVSVIVPTKNAEKYLRACLESIKAQTYKNIEMLVVDNFSHDTTRDIAQEFKTKVLLQGPERSRQVNYGVKRANGKYIYKVDADFTLEPEVIEQCVLKAQEGFEAVVVHNTPNENVSWIAKLRKFEVDMYKYDHLHSSPRFILKDVFNAVGGFNELITAGEDYDFRNKLDIAGYKTGFIDAEAIHHGEPTSFWEHMKKYYKYGKDIRFYAMAKHNALGRESTMFAKVYAKNWQKLLRHPLKTAALTIYTCCKALSGGLGWLVSLKNVQENS